MPILCFKEYASPRGWTADTQKLAFAARSCFLEIRRRYGRLLFLFPGICLALCKNFQLSAPSPPPPSPPLHILPLLPNDSLEVSSQVREVVMLFVPFSVTLLPATSESSTLSPLPDTQLSSHAPCSRPVIQANPSRAGPANQREFMGATTSGCGTCASSRGMGGACCSQPSDSAGTRCALRGVPSTMR